MILEYIILTIISILGVVGIFHSIRKIVRTTRAEKKFKTLLNDNPELKSRLKNLRLQARQESSFGKLGQVIDELAELTKQLPPTDREAMLDILRNNTHSGQVNYTLHILT